MYITRKMWKEVWVGECARGIIKRLRRTLIFIILVNKCFVFFENEEQHRIWQSCQTSPLCDRTMCAAKTLDIWIELTVYLRRRYFYVHAYVFATLFRWVVALCPLPSCEVGVGTVALLEKYIHSFIGRGFQAIWYLRGGVGCLFVCFYIDVNEKLIHVSCKIQNTCRGWERITFSSCIVW